MKKSSIDWEWLIQLLNDVNDRVIAQALGVFPTPLFNDAQNIATIECLEETEIEERWFFGEARWFLVSDLNIAVYYMFSIEGGIDMESITLKPRAPEEIYDDEGDKRELVRYAYRYLRLGYKIKKFKYRIDTDTEWMEFVPDWR